MSAASGSLHRHGPSFDRLCLKLQALLCHPEEIKSREVVLGLRVGLLSLQLFPNGGATDIVFVLHNSWDRSGVVRWSLRNAGRTLPLHSVVLAAVHGSLGLPGWRPFRGFTLLSPFSLSLLASADVKQQSLSLSLPLSVSRVTVQSQTRLHGMLPSVLEADHCSTVLRHHTQQFLPVLTAVA